MSSTNNQFKKEKWEQWELLVSKHYLARDYKLLHRNYTQRWWELDLIFTKNDMIIFVEVKVVNNIDDLCDYVSAQKAKNLQKTIEAYLRKYNIDSDVRVDIAFVKGNAICELMEGVILSELYL